MSAPHLNCHVCRTPFPPEDLSQSQGIAFCRRCQTLIRLDRHQPGAPRHPVAAAGFRPQVALPVGWDIQPTTQELRIVYHWFSATSFLLLFLCLFWFGFLVMWLTRAHQLPPAGPGLWFLSLLQIGIGLFLSYITLAGFLNTTTITVKQGHLTVVHAPLPWFQPPPLRTADITQLFVRRVSVGKQHSRREVYSVWAQLRQGREVKLMYGLEAPEQALFVEQQLEAFLGITDRPVPGELERWQ